MTKIYSPSFKNIPNHASTHYAADAYPTRAVTAKTVAGFAPKPMIQRKTSRKSQPILASVHAVVTSQETFNPKMPRVAFRKNIDKAARARYFDNDVLPSRAEIAQDKLDTWLMQTMFELENADIAKAEQNYKEIRAFVESVRAPKPTANITPDMSELDWRIQDEYDYDYDADYDPFAEELLMEQMYEAHYEPEYVGINSIDATEEDKFERLFFENEVNAHTRDVFEKKMARANQMRRDKRRQIYQEFLSRHK